VRVRHKDIKPENIVIDDFGLPILTDFGLSKHFEAGKFSEGPTPKTVKYADPEAMHEGLRDERSDIFSLGCVFLEMATVLLGKPPQFAEEQLSAATLASDGHSISSTSTSRDHGPSPISPEFKYSESLHNLDAYLTTLHLVARDLIACDPTREPSAKAVLAVLPHIRRMMDESLERRPHAHTLYPWFRHLYDIYEIPGPCPNCEEERRTGKAIPSRSGSSRSSPTVAMTRSATVVGLAGAAGAAGGSANGSGNGPSSSSQGMVRRGTVASMAGFAAAAAQFAASQASQRGGGTRVDGESDSD
jgi:serine/threonine protein kinase